jgi:NAD(P)-dependent dehydrogenase (short-subunit alcohol dehydrogenase family)
MASNEVGTGRLSGKRAFIVGASRGIGRVIALAFADAGASVAICARQPERLEAVATEIREADGVAVAIAGDCSDATDARRLVEGAHKQLGGLEIVVYAAGVHPAWARVGEQPIESWDATIKTNLSGCFYVCRWALPLLVAGGGGAIVSLSSVSGSRGWHLYSPYNVSKAGIENLTRTMAIEYGKDGVRANCVIPGVIDAGITFDILEKEPQQRKTLTDMHPVGRIGTAEEVAEAVLWLASDAASFTTGVSLPVDGGFLA